VIVVIDGQDAESIAVNFVKKKKNVGEVNVLVAEQKENVWVVRGTCPVDLCGHPWRESFEIQIDPKGNVRTSSFRLM
jgi:hypothetical protein